MDHAREVTTSVAAASVLLLYEYSAGLHYPLGSSMLLLSISSDALFIMKLPMYFGVAVNVMMK